MWTLTECGRPINDRCWYLSREYPTRTLLHYKSTLAQIAQRKDADKLFRAGAIYHVTRPGTTCRILVCRMSPCRCWRSPLCDLSSTDCRTRVEEGKPVGTWRSRSSNTRQQWPVPVLTKEKRELAELASLLPAAHRGGINPALVDVTSKLALADAS